MLDGFLLSRNTTIRAEDVSNELLAQRVMIHDEFTLAPRRILANYSRKRHLFD